MWQEFIDAMRVARSAAADESLGFLFCTRHGIGPRFTRLLPRAWVVPSVECYERQSSSGLELRQDLHVHLLRRFVQQGLDVVHVHSHPGTGRPSFSGVDNHYEEQYAAFLHRFAPGRIFISIVLDSELQNHATRGWRDGIPLPRDAVRLGTAWAGADHRQNVPATTVAQEERFSRQMVFGAGFQQELASLSVGLVGTSGLGAVFAEQLARLGVGRWVLVDPDAIEATNLNRLPFAAETAVGEPKVKYVKRLIKRAWPRGSHVTALRERVESGSARRELAACSIIAVATDNHYSRQEAQELALRYVRPLVSMATHIDVPHSAMPPRLLGRVTTPPVHGGWCLMCGDVVDAVASSTELASDEIRAVLREAGYIEGVPDPAVYWLNSLVASVAVSVVHGMVAGLLDAGTGVDWILKPSEGRWLSVPHDVGTECFYCGHEGEFAAGERDQDESISAHELLQVNCAQGSE